MRRGHHRLRPQARRRSHRLRCHDDQATHRHRHRRDLGRRRQRHVHGTAAAGSEVTVYSSEANRWFKADGSGNWTADFSTAGPEESVLDIVPGATGGAEQFDDDGDSTVIDWDVPRPEDWQHNPANGHEYLWSGQDGRSWAEAEAAAVSLGGHLVTVNDEAEMDWLVADTRGGLLHRPQRPGGQKATGSGQVARRSPSMPGRPTNRKTVGQVRRRRRWI